MILTIIEKSTLLSPLKTVNARAAPLIRKGIVLGRSPEQSRDNKQWYFEYSVGLDQNPVEAIALRGESSGLG